MGFSVERGWIETYIFQKYNGNTVETQVPSVEEILRTTYSHSSTGLHREAYLASAYLASAYLTKRSEVYFAQPISRSVFPLIT